jgi:hypothetical protein
MFLSSMASLPSWRPNGANEQMHALRHVFLVAIVTMMIGGFVFAAPTGSAAAQSVKQRLQQQQEQMRKKKMLEDQQLQAPSKPEAATVQPLGDEKSANQGRYDEANAIYRNLRIEQKLSHEAALSVLKNSGFPTDQIVKIP